MKSVLALLLEAAMIRAARSQEQYAQELENSRDGGYKTDLGAQLMAIERARSRRDRDQKRVEKILAAIRAKG